MRFRRWGGASAEEQEQEAVQEGVYYSPLEMIPYKKERKGRGQSNNTI